MPQLTQVREEKAGTLLAESRCELWFHSCLLAAALYLSSAPLYHLKCFC